MTDEQRILVILAAFLTTLPALYALGLALGTLISRM